MSDAAVELDAVTVVAATTAEARPLRRRLHTVQNVRVERGGVALSRWRPTTSTTIISCGLAGGLSGELATGSVVIPDLVRLEGGCVYHCDSELVARLRAAARACGVVPHPGPLVTTGHVVGGAERGLWSARGYAAADMESALLAQFAARFAVLRVVLDTSDRELSAAWRQPASAIARPWLWGQALWMARVAPRCCDLAARVVATALASDGAPAGLCRSAAGGADA